MDSPVETSEQKRREAAFRVAAAGLAGLPVGFATSAMLGGRLLTSPEDGGAMLLALGAFGALFGAGIMAFAATLLPARAARRATAGIGAVSAVVVAYMVFDFVTDRVARMRAFDEAYAALPAFELAFEARDVERRPFSTLFYHAETRAYTTRRPGGWLCRGNGARKHNMALYEALRAAQVANDASAGQMLAAGRAVACKLRVSWRIAEDPEVVRCASTAAERLVAAADGMIEDTERKSSCRRAEAR